MYTKRTEAHPGRNSPLFHPIYSTDYENLDMLRALVAP
jgi:hypothetical protein